MDEGHEFDCQKDLHKAPTPELESTWVYPNRVGFSKNVNQTSLDVIIEKLGTEVKQLVVRHQLITYCPF
jgi:hypothetical protein